MTEIISNPARVWAFLRSRDVKVPIVAGMKGIGLEKDGELLAGVLYEGFNGHNCWMHVAAQPGRHWLNREYLRTCFRYPFDEVGLSRVSGAVEANNMEARRFDEHLGFKQEAVLRGAASDGGDLILYVMRREDCRYVG